jgi:DNA-directed RNA polymerase specialized sigma subunit
MVALFFNSIFTSYDNFEVDDENNFAVQHVDDSEPYNVPLLNSYLKGLMQKYLVGNEYEVLRLSYGLDCDKHSAKEIASILNINGVSSYVRVSELKRQAVQRLIDNVDHSQVIDYL